ncbi:phage tail protein [[Enterobacter] lignolyticus]|uniref:Phage tail protein n=1 Tax=[Enterobacter] lignolyticus TaxID=1334193 RepID=A0A806XG90_9ENTR|nr:phage tail protein [[Enterobacter] lignolyticus]ALR77769.1 phage tail protein [[Enterobacter] lignolyticus]
MMLALGMFVFERRTLPYHSMRHSAEYGWASNAQVGKRSAYQFIGAGIEEITVSGALYPELTGGRISLSMLRLMAEQGNAWPLIGGNGVIYGMYVIKNIEETGTEFYSDGQPRKIDFTLTLTRVDESLTAMFGNLKDQATRLMNDAADKLATVGVS